MRGSIFVFFTVFMTGNYSFASGEVLTQQGQKEKNSLLDDLEISGEFRARYEFRDVAGYGSAANISEDTDLVLFRTRLGIELPIHKTIDFFFQIQDARTAGQEASTSSNSANLDALQAYIEAKKINSTPLSATLGRQKLDYGSGRVVSELDWNNVSRSWDGLKLNYDFDQFWVDGFYTVLSESSPLADDDQEFFGLYGSAPEILNFAGAKIIPDLYIFGRNFDDNAFTGETAAGPTEDRFDYTYGTYIHGEYMPVYYGVEFMLQTGKIGEDDIKSSAYAVELGYKFEEIKGNPRVGVEYTVATGDDDPTNGEINTFDMLFPFSHYYWGGMDLVGMQNMKIVTVKAAGNVYSKFWGYFEYHVFKLSESGDAWYDSAGNVVKTDSSGGAGRDIGSEIDIHFKYPLSDKMLLWFGWSHFIPGGFVEDAVPQTAKQMDWVFVQLRVTF